MSHPIACTPPAAGDPGVRQPHPFGFSGVVLAPPAPVVIVVPAVPPLVVVEVDPPDEPPVPVGVPPSRHASSGMQSIVQSQVEVARP